jgi:hypothetical protein
MDKLKYIQGDLVTNKYYTKVLIVIKTVKNMVYTRNRDAFSETYLSHKDDVVQMHLTPEILEKNGWERKVMSRGIKNSHLVYTKPDIEEYGYFPIYIEKGIGNEFDVYPFTDNNVCKQIACIKYVHELQHLLFGLGLKHEMEV